MRDESTKKVLNIHLFNDIDKTSSKLEQRPSQKTEDFVFYPSDNSGDLAFSVNLRNIAKHYIHDEGVRNVLTAKANEHLTKRKNGVTTKRHQHLPGDGRQLMNTEKPHQRTNNGYKNGSRLDDFFSTDKPHPSPDKNAVQSGKRSETFHNPVMYKLHVTWKLNESLLTLVLVWKSFVFAEVTAFKRCFTARFLKTIPNEKSLYVP